MWISSKYTYIQASQVVLVVKNPPPNAGYIRDASLIPGSGRSPGRKHDNPFQYFCLENPKDRGARWAAVHSVAKSWTWLKWLHTHACIHISPLSWAPHPTLLGHHREGVFSPVASQDAHSLCFLVHLWTARPAKENSRDMRGLWHSQGYMPSLLPASLASWAWELHLLGWDWLLFLFILFLDILLSHQNCFVFLPT